MGITIAPGLVVSDDVYGSGWNGDTTTAPSRNAMYDALAFSGCHLSKTGTQSIASSTTTALTFNVETFDTAGFHESVTNPSRITIPTGLGGVYMVGGAARITGMSDTKGITLMIYKNGSFHLTLAGDSLGAAGTGSTSGSQLLVLAAGDYVELRIFQSETGSKDVDSASCFFWCDRRAPTPA